MLELLNGNIKTPSHQAKLYCLLLLLTRRWKYLYEQFSGGPPDFGNGVHMYKGVGVRVADFI